MGQEMAEGAEGGGVWGGDVPSPLREVSGEGDVHFGGYL